MTEEEMDSILNELHSECFSLEEIDAMLNKIDPECCPLYDDDGKYMKSDRFLEQDDIDNILNSPGISLDEIEGTLLTLEEFNKLKKSEEN